jgi:hypothetical protein
MSIRFKNIKLTKVVNIFQKTYVNGKGNGFGDFLRGSVFLLQIALTYGLEFDVDYGNHIISKFLYKEQESVYSEIKYDKVFYIIGDWKPLNEKLYGEFIDYLNSITTNIEFFYTNNAPLHPITDFQKNIIKKSFLPNKMLKDEIEQTMCNLGLIEKQFNCIHIRTGDRFLLFNEIDHSLFIKIAKTMNSKIIPGNKYLILSDSAELKTLLKTKFSNLIIWVNDIIHLGEIDDNSKVHDGVKDTLVDFFIMSKSNHIHGITVYEHGTGFSEYCSKLFDIGYDCTLIKDENIHKTRDCAL